MATVAVTGNLRTYSGLDLQNRWPRLTFRPSGSGIAAGKLLSKEPVVAELSPNGFFKAMLEETDLIRPDVWYTAHLTYLFEPHPADSPDALRGLDVWPFQIRVPVGGGLISSFPGVPLAVGTTWISLDPPPAGFKGFWVQAGEDPDDPRNTGNIYPVT